MPATTTAPSAFTLINRDHKSAIAAFKATLIAAAIEIAFAHFGMSPSKEVLLVTGVPMVLTGLILIKAHLGKKAGSRYFGQSLEQSAIRDLSRIIPSSWHIETGLKSNGSGDIDICLRTGKDVFAIEVKAYHGLKIHSGKLIKANGDKLSKDPADQARRAAYTVDGTPIIWMPSVKESNVFLFEDVKIVSGSAKYLLKQL